MAAPRVMTFEEYQRYAGQANAPRQVLPPVPPLVGPPSLYMPPGIGRDSYDSAQPLPYAPIPPPQPLDETPPRRAWKRMPTRGY